MQSFKKKTFYMYKLEIFAFHLFKIWIKHVLCEIHAILVMKKIMEMLCFMNAIYEIMF